MLLSKGAVLGLFVAIIFLVGCAEKSGFGMNNNNSVFWLRTSISNVEVIDGNTLRVTTGKGSMVTGTGELELHGIRFEGIEENQAARLRLEQILRHAAKDDQPQKFRCYPENETYRNPTYKPVSASCTISEYNVKVFIGSHKEITDGSHCRPVFFDNTGLPYSPGVSIRLLQLGYARYKETTHKPSSLEGAEILARECGCGWWSIHDNWRRKNSNDCKGVIQP